MANPFSAVADKVGSWKDRFRFVLLSVNPAKRWNRAIWLSTGLCFVCGSFIEFCANSKVWLYEPDNPQNITKVFNRWQSVLIIGFTYGVLALLFGSIVRWIKTWLDGDEYA